jgi:hypothetical protein
MLFKKRGVMETNQLHERFTKERSALERLRAKIPGLSGYIEYTERYNSDRIVRQFASERLVDCKRSLRSAMEKLARDGKLDVMTQLDRIDIALETLTKGLQSVEPAVSSSFSHNRPRLTDEEYANAISLDDRFVNDIDQLMTSIKGLSADKVQESVDGIESGMNEIDSILIMRKKLLWGI